MQQIMASIFIRKTVEIKRKDILNQSLSRSKLRVVNHAKCLFCYTLISKGELKNVLSTKIAFSYRPLVCYCVKMNDINYKIIEIFCCITFSTRNLLY